MSKGSGVRVCFFGHTHRRALWYRDIRGKVALQEIAAPKVDLSREGHYLINPGSVGQPHDGNPKAQAIVAEVLGLRAEFEWRGLGILKKSALALRREFAEYDAEKRFDLAYRVVPDNKACECGAILRGVKRPQDCASFGTVCTPENPVGSCMVSSEGACAAHYTYGRYQQ